jgi:alginate O-acetyltransferase complex protein AlgI
MVFSSTVFLFIFLPFVLILYFSVPSAWKNSALLFASLLFYFYGESYLTAILVFYIVFNYYISCEIVSRCLLQRRIFVFVGVSVDIGILIYFKYTNLLWGSLHDALLQKVDIGAAPEVLLPIGISFFAFQAISYLLDVNAGRARPPERLIDFGMYKAAFPQLIAGPIVRYTDIQDRIQNRLVKLDDLYAGSIRFCIGLGKKVVIADQIGTLADKVFQTPAGDLSTGAAWAGVLAYSMQIYFDFSGYSDMAIGLGRVFGFKYPENFNQPYRSENVTEFWRRWHMTLSRWFRDYLYIPLGGNKKGTVRTAVNLVLVFALCGLWHGAAWRFLVWGLFHGVMLSIERVTFTLWAWRPSGWLGRISTFLLVTIGWVFFRSQDLSYARNFLQTMFSLKSTGALNLELIYASISSEILAAAVAAFAISFIPKETATRFISTGVYATIAQSVLALAAIIYASSKIVLLGFNPFIYFQF